MSNRGVRDPNLSEKLASMLLTIQRPGTSGKLEPVISRERAKTMTAAEIIAQFECDHDVLVAFADKTRPDRVNHPTNLTMRPKPEHREKTAKRDVPAVAKSKRLIKSEKLHADIMAQKAGLAPRETGAAPRAPRSSWGGARPIPGSRNSPYKRKLNGRTELRDV